MLLLTNQNPVQILISRIGQHLTASAELVNVSPGAIGEALSDLGPHNNSASSTDIFYFIVHWQYLHTADLQRERKRDALQIELDVAVGYIPIRTDIDVYDCQFNVLP